MRKERRLLLRNSKHWLKPTTYTPISITGKGGHMACTCIHKTLQEDTTGCDNINAPGQSGSVEYNNIHCTVWESSWISLQEKAPAEAAPDLTWQLHSPPKCHSEVKIPLIHWFIPQHSVQCCMTHISPHNTLLHGYALHKQRMPLPVFCSSTAMMTSLQGWLPTGGIHYGIMSYSIYSSSVVTSCEITF